MEKIKISYPDNAVFDAVRKVLKILRSAGFPAYVVGGAVRDLVLGRVPDDVDMVTTARPDEVKKLFPEAEMVGACFGVVLVKVHGEVFEVATCREERLYQDGRRPDEVIFTDDFQLDVQRRDFTVNAMLYDPESGEVLDFTGGLQDAAMKILRVVGEPSERFAEDYLRMLRAIRFAARLDFEIDHAAWQAIADMAHLTDKLAVERVRAELEMMLCGSNPGRALRMLKSSGILKVVLPEVDALEGVAQPAQYHPEGDVWQHTLLMFENLRGKPSAALAWSILLHDVGKKPAFSRDENNVPHFYCHEAVGADMVLEIAERLRFSAEMRDCVEHAVRNHMRFAFVREMRTAKLRRLLAEKNFDLELELHYLDCFCSNKLMGSYEFLKSLQSRVEFQALPDPLIGGDDLITLGYTPGPEFKTILKSVMDAQLESKIVSKADALQLVLEKYPQQG